MRDAQPKAVRRSDYRPPDYLIDETRLAFDLREDHAVVDSRLRLRRNPAAERARARGGSGVDSGSKPHGERERGKPGGETLELHGENLELLALELDGRPLAPGEYQFTAGGLRIPGCPDAFELRCLTRIKPQENTELEGLYRSRGMFCTQCEAEGFRKITYYLDRPDVMSRFTVRVEADRENYPVLLSNGNLVASGESGASREAGMGSEAGMSGKAEADGEAGASRDAGAAATGVKSRARGGAAAASGGSEVRRGESRARHWALWEDPFPKPAYLFALVAGKLSRLSDHFTTCSGREVALHIHVEEKDLGKCAHAMASLNRAMRWDEETFGREYDLDVFNIVAVDDFNMGAMENKSLNIFNTACVLAHPDTTADSDYQRVEAIVAHEYFHNWSGNRVTCRDWFQLSLKEGFTVFRDAEFSADMGSRAVKRIEDAAVLRSAQFTEDSGPMAHPVRPDSYIEISNFYTLTVYEKGAEVVRMLRTLLGAEAFRQGSDLYFERHDGQAVTCDDFVCAMEAASGRDLAQFRRWYSQAGTPMVAVSDDWDEAAGMYTLTFKQSCPPTPGQPEKEPFVIPVAMGLLGAEGGLPLRLEVDGEVRVGVDVGDSVGGNGGDSASAGESKSPNESVGAGAGETESANESVGAGESGNAAAGYRTVVLELNRAEQTFQFSGLRERPLPSLLRDFSAPVKLAYPYTREQLAALMAGDEDGFCRWDAGQQLAVAVIGDLQKESSVPSPSSFPRKRESRKDQRDSPELGAKGRGNDEEGVLQHPDGEGQIDGKGQSADPAAGFIAAVRRLLTDAGPAADSAPDPAMLAAMLSLPSENYLAGIAEPVDVDAIHLGRERLRSAVAERCRDLLLARYRALETSEPYRPDAAQIGRRSLRNACLAYLGLAGEIGIAQEQYRASANMTDTLAALSILIDHAEDDARQNALDEFYERWRDEPLVVNQWLRAQALSARSDTLSRVRELLRHPAFELGNPNKVRALVSAFCSANPYQFHQPGGGGYALLADIVSELNSRNPQIAARLLSPLTPWRRYGDRAAPMREALERLAALPALSKDVYEVVSKSLKD